MPYGDLNPGARRRHNVRVILKTKSEISALSDFLDWLEKEKGDGSIILIYHEPRRLSPTMLLEALTSYALAADKCKATVKSVSLRVLARVLLDADSLAQEVGGGGEGGATQDMVETARAWARPVRRLLADAGLLYDQLQTSWEQNQLAGLEKELGELSVSAKEEDIKELIEIFDCHFDPAKEPKGPKPRTPRNNMRPRATSSAGETNDAEGSTSESQN
ncbi:Exuperantia, partial [Operophtera brumata]